MILLVVLAACTEGQPSERNTPSISVTGPTVSTSTTLDPLAQAEIDLRGAQKRYYEAYLAAVAKPGNVDLVANLLDVYQEGGPGAKGIKKRMKLLADNGFAARPGPKAYFVVQSVKVSSASPGATAQVSVCSYYDGVTYDTRHDGPDGKPITVDDRVESGRTRYRYVHQAGEWKLVGGDVLKSWTGETHCPAR